MKVLTTLGRGVLICHIFIATSLLPDRSFAQPTDKDLTAGINEELTNYDLNKFDVIERETVGNLSNRTYMARFKATVALNVDLFEYDRSEKDAKNVKRTFIKRTHAKGTALEVYGLIRSYKHNDNYRHRVRFDESPNLVHIGKLEKRFKNPIITGSDSEAAWLSDRRAVVAKKKEAIRDWGSQIIEDLIGEWVNVSESNSLKSIIFNKDFSYVQTIKDRKKFNTKTGTWKLDRIGYITLDNRRDAHGLLKISELNSDIFKYSYVAIPFSFARAGVDPKVRYWNLSKSLKILGGISKSISKSDSAFNIAMLAADSNGAYFWSRIGRSNADIATQDIKVECKKGKTENSIKSECEIFFYNNEFVWRDIVLAAQRKLSKLGFASGKADGIMGSNTREAISSFQSKNGLSVDGKLTYDTVKKLKLR